MDEGNRLSGGHPSIHVTPGAVAVGEEQKQGLGREIWGNFLAIVFSSEFVLGVGIFFLSLSAIKLLTNWFYIYWIIRNGSSYRGEVQQLVDEGLALRTLDMEKFRGISDAYGIPWAPLFRRMQQAVNGWMVYQPTFT